MRTIVTVNGTLLKNTFTELLKVLVADQEKVEEDQELIQKNQKPLKKPEPEKVEADLPNALLRRLKKTVKWTKMRQFRPKKEGVVDLKLIRKQLMNLNRKWKLKSLMMKMIVKKTVKKLTKVPKVKKMTNKNIFTEK